MNMTIERRATPRLEVLEQLHGQLVPLGVPFLMRELGAGGFSVESIVRFPLGARHRFRFTTADNVEVILEATVMHSGPSGPVDDGTSYMTGFAFVHDAADETWRAVDTLLDAVVDVLHAG